MGIVVIGGMLTSTFLTLFVIPMVYTIFADIGAKLRRKPVTEATPLEAVPVK